MTLWVGASLDRSRAEGPGWRSVLWLQGCSIRCKGCFNPQFFQFGKGQERKVQDLADQFLRSDTEGVTLLGGEPFDQAPGVAALVGRLKEKGMNTLVFSGYPYTKLTGTPKESWRELLEGTDLLVAGPYLKNQQDFQKNMIGSSNQTLHPRTPEGWDLLKRMQADQNRIELRISPDGGLFVNGQGKALEGMVTF